MLETANRQLLLVARPEGAVEARHFAMREQPVPEPAEGQALVRVQWLGIDPTQRTWLNAQETYIPPVPLGTVMRGTGVGQVIASRSKLFDPGDWLVGPTGWQDFVLSDGDGVRGFTKIPEGIEPRAMLSVFGVNGLTAYFGMMEIGRPEPGQTVLVTGAAGGVGSIAGQIARVNGCRVIGSAGDGRKCTWVREIAKFDACVDYRRERLGERLGELAPGGLDIVFDNVGGEALEAALDHIAHGARVVLSGSISSGYRDAAYGQGPANYMQLAFKRARMEGFVFFDYAAHFPAALHQMLAWVRSGDIRYEETISRGLETAPAALAGLFHGRNLGKQLVRLF